MNKDAYAQIRQTLDAWRAQGANRVDSLSLDLIEAMLARVEGRTEARVQQVLYTRLKALIENHAKRLEQDSAAHAMRHAEGGSDPAPASDAAMPAANDARPSDASARLSALTEQMARPVVPLTDAAPSSAFSDWRAQYPELPILDEFRAIWSRVNVNRRIQQTQEQVHENAGPLNSGHLVHRTLSYMRDVSPGYLEQFLSYLDNLAWVEQLHLTQTPPKEGRRHRTKPAAKRAARKTAKKNA